MSCNLDFIFPVISTLKANVFIQRGHQFSLAGDDGAWLQRAASRTQNLFSRRTFDGVSRLGCPRFASGPMGGVHLLRFISIRGSGIVVGA